MTGSGCIFYSKDSVTKLIFMKNDFAVVRDIAQCS